MKFDVLIYSFLLPCNYTISTLTEVVEENKWYFNAEVIQSTQSFTRKNFQNI